MRRNVWNKDNIAKVERDEAAHAAKEREDAARTQRADGEARLELLRKRARILRGEDPEVVAVGRRGGPCVC